MILNFYITPNIFLMKYLNLPRLLLSYAIALCLVISGFAVKAQQPSVRKIPFSQQALSRQAKPVSKVSNDLLGLKKEFESYVSKRGNARTSAAFEPLKPLNKMAPVQNGYVTVDAVADGNTQSLLSDLKAAGMINAVAFGRIVSGRIPIGQLDKMADMASLRFVRAAYSTANIGEATSQGDVAQRSDIARSKYKVEGRDVKIGFISDSYNALEGAEAGVLSGDLPGEENPNGYTTPVQILEDLYPGEGTDEGRAMAEIIHDVAPAATLAFHTALGGQANFAQGIIDLKDAGCDLIVDDIIYLAEPFFQDGIISQAVDFVSNEGVGYFCSAGNYARNSYESEYTPSDKTYIFGQAHSFAPGDELQDITIARGNTVRIVFQWSDPFYSVSGASGAKSDLDIYLMDNAGLNVLASSYESNIGGDPVEIIEYRNLGFETTFKVLIEKYSGPNPAKIKYIVFGGEIAEHATNSATIFGHHNAENALSVGAAFWFFTPEYAADPPVIQQYSSVGGTPTLFDASGNPVNIVRPRPVFTAPDGGNTTFFGQLISFAGDFDQYPNFFGTSAAAPHATAVAALMMEAGNYSLSKAQIVQAMQSTSIDMDDALLPDFQTGFDYQTGSGLIQADAAVAAVFKGQQLVSFTLINADNGKDLLKIEEGTVINLAALPTTNLNIRANTNTKVGSVIFEFNGKTVTENSPPYALAGDSHTQLPFKYNSLNPPLTPGEYSLSATPYTLSKGKGKAGISLTVTFIVTEQIDVVSFTLVNADNAEDIYELTDPVAVIDLDELPTKNLNIRANTNSKRTGSVIISLTLPDGGDIITAVENRWPFALGGDFNNGGKNYKALDPALTAGDYLLRASAFTGKNGEGSEGPERLIQLTVVGGENTIARKAFSAENNQAGTLRTFPNPVVDKFTLQFGSESGLNEVTIYNPKGQVVHNFLISGAPEKRVDMSGLPAGLYMLKVQGNGRTQTMKILKQ